MSAAGGGSSQRTQFIYALIVITVIPALLVANTVWLLVQSKSNLDTELRRKANVTAEALSALTQAVTDSTVPAASQRTILQAAAENLPRSEADIIEAALIQPSATGYTILASSTASEVGSAADNVLARSAWEQKQPVAALIDLAERGSRAWRVVTPITGPDGRYTLLASVTVSAAAVEAAETRTLRISMVLLVVFVLIMVALLLNHLRFAGYADLFRRQKELDQLKDDFISIATHELKSPMSVIKGYISMVMEGDAGTVDQLGRETLQVAYDHTERLNRLVTDLLNVSRLQQGRTVYDLREVKLPTLIAPLVTDYSVKAKAKKMTVRYTPPADLPSVKADPDRVGEVMANLIDNAVKYSLKGSVTIAHSIDGGMVCTKVTDTGIGMTPEEQTRLFERFYRARNAETREIPGTGLGLWIIRQYIEQMGGTITLESAKGKGTSFTVSLPRFGA